MRVKYMGPARSYGFLTEKGHRYFSKNQWIEVEDSLIEKLERIKHQDKCCFQFKYKTDDLVSEGEGKVEVRKKYRKNMSRSVLENELENKELNGS